MKPIIEILHQEGFLKSLFEAIPCGLLIIDQNRRIHAINNVLERSLGISSTDALNRRSGEAMRCIHSSSDPKGCGFSEECRDCVVRITAQEALSGRLIHRVSARIRLLVEGKYQTFKFLVSASPFDHDGRKMAVILLEDITELNLLRERFNNKHGFAGIIGHDPKMIELFETIREVMDINVPILIQGESGTGKELVARAIHDEGIRSNEPFVPVNCAALPEGLLESELFGHVKGAFTGAARDKRGRFELADRGTLFLDEIGDMSKVVQAKLLRVLQEGTFERVGDEKPVSVNVRIISATNRNLKREVEKGNFREDLFYRLNVIPIFIPPLRKRRGDINLLVDYFLNKASSDGIDCGGLSKDTMTCLVSYPWPGNVRELQSAIHYALVKSKGTSITPLNLPDEIKNHQGEYTSRGPNRRLNRQKVKEALIRSGGNKVKASRLLGVGRATLYRFLSAFPDVS
ncbi:MAG: sigma 54-interacting transcriptional regulator [Deltaproteobacteria bacterium]|nr:sigma 54-interacting transcriptional regulator [Deltaproteobacteria bacterium]